MTIVQNKIFNFKRSMFGFLFSYLRIVLGDDILDSGIKKYVKKNMFEFLLGKKKM